MLIWISEYNTIYHNYVDNFNRSLQSKHYSVNYIYYFLPLFPFPFLCHPLSLPPSLPAFVASLPPSLILYSLLSVLSSCLPYLFPKEFSLKTYWPLKILFLVGWLTLTKNAMIWIWQKGCNHCPLKYLYLLIRLNELINIINKYILYDL